MVTSFSAASSLMSPLKILHRIALKKLPIWTPKTRWRFPPLQPLEFPYIQRVKCFSDGLRIPIRVRFFT
jgi:hypothetical protein